MNLQERVTRAFEERFVAEPAWVIRAPGRVNLIGEHTDYSDGFVLPMAIDRAVWIALRPREDRHVLVHSLEQPKPADFALNGIQHSVGEWSEYLKGMAVMLEEAGYQLRGWEGILTSDVPIGSGLSSSAAMEMGIGYAFSVVSSFPFDGPEMARLGQKTENKWVGANTGIMDQMISANGRAGHAMLIDCRALSMEAIPLPQGTAIVVMDTMTRHNHTDSGYNDRRESCERAAAFFRVSHLRDVTYTRFLADSSALDSVTRRRARHVITENQRVLEAVLTMKAGDAARLGELMNASHASLRDDFEVTNLELDFMAKIARAKTGCYGSRMTGGGFGGCAVALVQIDKVESICSAVAREYEAFAAISPNVFVTTATNGAAVIR